MASAASPTLPPEADALLRAGVAAMQRRDAAAARAAFERLAGFGPPVPPPWLLLAQACRLGGDGNAEARALDALLAAEPRDLRGLVMRGDLHARAGDPRAMTSFYQAALKIAAGATAPLPPALTAELDRVRGVLVQASLGYRDHLERALAARGVGPRGRSARVQESLDILYGEKQPYFQAPTSFFFPQLPQRQFYEREEFAWLPTVEAAAPAMREELEALLTADDAAFTPYLEATPNRPVMQAHRVGDPSWTAYHLWRRGAPVPGHAERFPRTLEALRASGAPLPRIGARSPMILFSSLRPGAHIPPHSGMLNSRLIVHLPLIVPPGCSFRVGNDVRSWEFGRALLFDDTIEHEAWNRGSETRVILLFEIWRPELSGAERDELTAVFEAIESYGPGLGEYDG